MNVLFLFHVSFYDICRFESLVNQRIVTVKTQRVLHVMDTYILDHAQIANILLVQLECSYVRVKYQFSNIIRMG
jgi:hypothetical protein